jgi:DNA-binding transcriptional MerR regulator
MSGPDSPAGTETAMATAWSIAEVARMSGVTSRTLRHYDDVGLLAPASVGRNGYRYYEEPELLQLQQILVMRELGLGLQEIGAVLAEQVDRTEALRTHHARLVAERDRLDVLARTVSRTIAELEQAKGGNSMTKINRPENLFEGFDGTRQSDGARERWPEAWEQTQQVIGTLTAEDMAQWQREVTAQMIRIAEFMAAGTPVTDDAVQAEMHAHYQGVCRFWTPNAAAYKALGQTYVDDPEFRSNYDRIADGLAVYQCDAMAVYADARLS